jgi:Ribbon-helix-helix domain
MAPAQKGTSLVVSEPRLLSRNQRNHVQKWSLTSTSYDIILRDMKTKRSYDLPVRLPNELYARLQELSVQTLASKAAIVRKALEEYLERVNGKRNSTRKK